MHVVCIKKQEVKGDGRCLYRAIALSLFNDQDRHFQVLMYPITMPMYIIPKVMDDIHKYKLEHPEAVTTFFSGTERSREAQYQKNLKNTSVPHNKSPTKDLWGTDIELAIAAKVYKSNIYDVGLPVNS